LKTLLGFLHFARKKVDFACVEVGLGGRLDATNIVKPAVTVITNIGLDHIPQLGDTHTQIAGEKAGIIKPEVPCFTATDHPDALEVITRISQERNAPLVRVRRDSDIEKEAETQNVVWSVPVSQEHTGTVTIRTPRRCYADLTMRMGGLYQRANAACAVVAAEEALEARGVTLPEEAVRGALATTALPGRLTILRVPDGPLVVLDGAHNELAAQSLAGPIAALRTQHNIRRLLLVIGMLDGHEPEGVLAALAPQAERIFVCQPQWKRALPADELAKVARKFTRRVKAVPSCAEAARTALAAAGAEDMILITGSFYTVGEVPLTLFDRETL
jgi:dihydrofolate synthase/folylpolyglutamate synthase